MNATLALPVKFPKTSVSAALEPFIQAWCSGWKFIAILPCVSNLVGAAQYGNFNYTENTSDITITGYVTAPTGPVVIPDTINSKPVAKIGYRAYYNCLGITGMTVPKSVIIVDTEAFAYCSNIAHYSISASGAPVTTGNGNIGVGAFANCFAMANVDISPRTQSIGASAFFNCSTLSSISIPPLVSTIGSRSFQSCYNLVNFTLPPALASIQSKAFVSCRSLTSITIPASVTSISTEVFASCSSLTTIFVESTNPNFSSLDGVLFNKDQTFLKAFPPARSGGYEVPVNVTGIEIRAFFACDKLVGVTFPSSLLSISQEAFYTCRKLRFANFKGDAPVLSFGVFSVVASDFAVYFMAGAVDFPVPPDDMFWYGYPAVNMGSEVSPTTALLLSKGLPANSDLKSDTNGDGVNLLLACALNLDPFQNLSDKIPNPIMVGNQMNLTFYAGVAGITYGVETSCDLNNWSSVGVTLSAPDANLNCTASASVSGPCLYMRLAVSN